MDMLGNPLVMYAVSFLLVLLIYNFHWSEFYPELSDGLELFILFSIVISFVIGNCLQKVEIHEKNVNFFSEVNLKSCVFVVFFIYFCLVIEIIQSGGLPIISIVFGDARVNYSQFGIPVFHVLFIIFKQCYEILTYYFYIKKKKKEYLYCFVALLFIDILIVNRANILFVFIVASVIWNDCKNDYKYGFRYWFYLFISSILLFYLFGVLGNYRSAVAFGSEYSNDFIYTIGQATYSFRESIVPGEFFWSYLYISSPLANLQHTVQTLNSVDVDYMLDMDSIISVIGYAGVPDFISKRIMPALGYYYPATELIEDNLNVCTMYNISYCFAGYVGMVMHYLFFLCVVLTVSFLSFNTPYASIIKGILCAIAVFSVFVNSIAFVGWIGQIYFFLLLSKNKSFEKYFLYRNK